MVSALFLQASTTPQSTPYAVYATLAVGVLSLIASGLNIYFSSKTAQKVVNLSTKTTREVAELSAQVSRESAGLAAETARELKEKDYKNDFYRKILEKRLSAWVEGEQVFFHIRADVYYRKDGKSSFKFFSNEKDFTDTLSKVNKMVVSHIMWLDKECSNSVSKFRNKLLDINNEIIEKNDGDMNAEKLSELGFENFEELSLIYNKILLSFAAQLSSIHEIEEFLKKRANGKI